MQMSSCEWGLAAKEKQRRRERFMDQIEAATLWALLVDQIDKGYPNGERGRPPIGIERILPMYILQQGLGLSDNASDDAVYDGQLVLTFVGIDRSREGAPDATTQLHFRRLVERHDLTQVTFESINDHLMVKGLLLLAGTTVGATILAEPPSTKNRAKARDPEVYQAMKGNDWFFGMKAQIVLAVVSGRVHTVTGTAANISFVSQAAHPLHGEENSAHADT
jgi:IS5 family transposase